MLALQLLAIATFIAAAAAPVVAGPRHSSGHLGLRNRVL